MPQNSCISARIIGVLGAVEQEVLLAELSGSGQTVYMTLGFAKHSILRCLARHRLSSWLARALALLLVLGNAFAAVAPVRMLAMAAPAAPAVAHASHAAMDATQPGSIADSGSMVAMHQHHHPRAAADCADQSNASDSMQHGQGCPCCNGGQCGCAQTCSPLPMIAALLSASSQLAAVVPMARRVAPAASIRGVPPLRPPIA